MARHETLESLEAMYMNGIADEISGDVESPTGHFYRVGRYIVTTDSQGFRNVEVFESEWLAMGEFRSRNKDYNTWGDDGA